MHRKCFKLICMVLIFLAGFSIPHANARGGVFVIGPMQEATETVELVVSESSSANVCGNVSVINGFIDFYVTSPSGNIILCYNKTSFNCFNFSAVENGTYIMHLVNTWSENDVTATLDYGVNFEIVLQETIHTTEQTAIVTTSPSFDILELLKILGIIISPFVSLAVLGEKILRFLRWFYWKIKHGKSKTPVVFKLIEHILVERGASVGHSD